MFIRKVTHLNKRNGTQYHTYKLVESIRIQAGPRQKTILNLGTNFNLLEEDWKTLANRIEDMLSGQISLLEYPEKIESLAKKYARKIIRQNSYLPAINELPITPSNYTPDYQTVDINSLENEESRTIGAEGVVYHTIKKLQLDQKLIELGFSKPQVDVAIGVITGRLISPNSERATHIWLQEISGIGEVMNTDK